MRLADGMMMVREARLWRERRLEGGTGADHMPSVCGKRQAVVSGDVQESTYRVVPIGRVPVVPVEDGGEEE